MNRNFKNIARKRHGTPRLSALFALLICSLSFAISANAASYEARSRTLLAEESCLPLNGAIDPGETNTVSFVIRNKSGATLEEVKATLLSTGGVQFPLTGEQTIGTVANDADRTVTFRFRAGGVCTQTLVPTLRITAKNHDAVDLSFEGFQLGATVHTPYSFSNAGVITINDFDGSDANKQGRASPYPSTITASNVPNTAREKVSKVSVTLNNLSHSFVQDVRALLVHVPTGRKVLLMQNTGGQSAGNSAVSGVTLTFDGTSGTSLPANGQIVSGTFRPSVNGEVTTLPGAPAAPYTDNLHDSFDNLDANGSWQLYVQDDQAVDGGVISGGWTLTITTTKISCCGEGDTWPFITQGGAPSLAKFEIPEDSKFETGQGGPVSPAMLFDVGDLETAAGSLALSATTSDESLIKTSGIRFGGSGANRTAIFQPESNRFGTANVTITATDGAGKTATATFVLQVNSVNDLPTFSTILNQSVNQGTSTPPIPFTLGDVETDPTFVILTGTSSDTGVVPNANIFFGGGGSSRTVTVIPATTSTTGQTTITIAARDSDGGTSTSSFIVNFDAQIGDPTITPIGPQSANEDTVKSINFTVRSGTTTPVGSLSVTRDSSNTTLLPLNNIVISGIGNDRILQLTPAPNQFGTTQVTIAVRDPANNRIRSTTFTFTVAAVNDKPTITAISDQIINEDTSTPDLLFTVADVETPAADLIVEATSNNPTLVPPGSITFPDNVGGDRTIKITPVANQNGRALITITVRDAAAGGESASRSFLLTVNAVNDPPAIAQVNGVNLAGNPDDAPIAITIPEDIALTGDGSAVVEQSIALQGIVAGPGPETDQTVTITAAVNNANVIQSVRFEENRDRVKSPTVDTVLRYTPRRNAFGEATITLTLTDDAGGSNTTIRKFRIVVSPVNDAPSLAEIPNRTIARDNGVAIAINVSDIETPTPLIEMTATSSATGIIPNSGLIFDAGNLTLTVIPVPGVTEGESTITVQARDNGQNNDGVNRLTATRTFIVTIADITPPTLVITPAERTVQEDSVASFVINLTDDKPVSQLRLVGSSSNPSLVPNENILFGGANGGRTVAIVPAKDQNGTADITISVTDEDQLDASRTVRVIVTGVEDPPAITLLKSLARGSHSDNEDANPVKDTSPDTNGLLEFEVSDAETAADSLVITVSSKVPGSTADSPVVPPGNISWSSTGTRRVLTIVPAANQHGVARITLTVRDGAGKIDAKSFDLTINPVNDAPTLAAIDNRTIVEDAGQQSVSLTGISRGAANETDQTVTITARAIDKGTDPNNNINNLIDNLTVNYTSPSETGSLTFSPRANASGVSTITLTVRDNGPSNDPNKNETTRTFEVTITAVNDLPTLVVNNNINEVNTAQGTPTQVIPVVISDVETAASQLLVTATSANAILVPNNPANLNLGGSGQNRGLIVTPAPNQFGTSEITVTVADANGGTRSDSFILIVSAGENPIISDIPNQTIPINGETDLIVFNVNDAQTPAADLLVNATSSNQTLVPNSLIQFGGSGSERLMVIRAAANQIGTTTITVTVTDSSGRTAVDTFTLSVRGQPPTISTIADREIQVGGSTGPIPFTVNDAETFAALLTLERSSSNPALVPVSNILFGGSGANRTVTIVGAQGATGLSTITITVRDSEGQTASTTFAVRTPGAQNTPPTISDIPNQIVNNAGDSTGTIPFTVGDAETFPALLTIAANSSNQALVPNANIALGGSGANRTVRVTTAPNQSGTAVITVTVSDGSSQASDTFSVTVPGGNTAPTITAIPAQTTLVNTPTSVISFQVGDAESAPGSLVVTAASGNIALVPNNSIFLGGSGANRTLFISPAQNQSGTATITISVSDGSRITSTSFILTVRRTVSNSSDFNGDGMADIVFQDNGGFLAAWFMNGSVLSSASYLNPNNTGDPNWRVVAGADINNDGEADLLFQHTDGTLAAWYMNDSTLTSSTLLNPSNPGDVNWRAVASGDFNQDGRADIAFQHTDGTLAAWYMNGVDLASASLLNPSSPGDINWRLAGVGDFNNDAKSDLVFQHTNGDLAAWYMNGIDLVAGTLLNPSNSGDAQYRVHGVTDLNGDGNSDLLFQHADGRLATWFMRGIDLIRGEALTPSAPGGTWRIVAP